jgi:hypothetical protein
MVDFHERPAQAAQPSQPISMGSLNPLCEIPSKTKIEHPDTKPLIRATVKPDLCEALPGRLSQLHVWAAIRKSCSDLASKLLFI